ncbi:MAG: hypothetical protein WAO04_12440 [Candidatus Sulfotelmatobacter sp.]
MPNHYIGDLLHTIGMFGLSRVRTYSSLECTSVPIDADAIPDAENRDLRQLLACHVAAPLG